VGALLDVCEARLSWTGLCCRIYRVYDLRSYELLYSLADKSVSEVKISPGIMLVIHNATSSVPLKILNIEDGTVLKVHLMSCLACIGGFLLEGSLKNSCHASGRRAPQLIAQEALLRPA